jgi:hypothetical protein
LVPQLSLAVTPLNTFGTSAWQSSSALATGTAGQLTLGGVVSITVKIVSQVAVLPAASVAVTVIVCGPGPSKVPTGGSWLRMIALVAVQFSLTVTPARTFGIAAWQLPLALASGTAGQITTGTVVSFTMKVVVQVAKLPAASVAVTMIVFVPNPTSVPAIGD